MRGANLRGSVRFVAADLTAGESARVIRAAMGYAGLEFGELADLTGIPTGTLRGYASRSRPIKAPLEKRRLIGERCGVPLSFVEAGFTLGRGDDLEDRVAAVEARLAALEAARLPPSE